MKHKNEPGFALISTISIMVLLVVLAVGITNLSSSTDQKVTVKGGEQRARANARLALARALSQLQEFAGVDQRTTAAASILNGQAINPQAPNSTFPYAPNGSNVTITANDFLSKWTGVWNTESHIQATPDSKEFMQWLVSGEPTLLADIASSETAVTPATTGFHTIFEGVTGAPDSDTVIVPMVNIVDGGLVTGNYAYWTEDVGLKADLSWSESRSADDDLKQATRLSVAPGVDYSLVEGPFASSGSAEYSEANQDWLALLNNAYNLADAPLAVNSGSSERDWSKEKRHDFDIGSMGVLADMKDGGLKRDLSLAFEMDDEEEAADADNFNNQIGEFVGGDDGLQDANATNSTDYTHDGMNGHVARFLYRHTLNSGKVFSDASLFDEPGEAPRGVTWWAMRDFANLYKRVSKTGTNTYGLNARAYLPNNSASNSSIGAIHAAAIYESWSDTFVGSNQQNVIYRPAQSSYAPVILGNQTLIGAKGNDAGKLHITFDSIFYIWNPYNINLTFPGLVVRSTTHPITGVIEVWNRKAGMPDESDDPALNAFQFFNNANNVRSETGYLLQDPANPTITMTPGEIMVFSTTGTTSNSPSKLQVLCQPGYFENGFNDSGIQVTDFPGAGTEVYNDEDELGFVFVRGSNGPGFSGSLRYQHEVFIAPADATVSNFYDNPGLATQSINTNNSSSASGYAEILSEISQQNVRTNDLNSTTNEDGTGFNSTIPFSELKAGKRFFASVNHMLRPSNLEVTSPSATSAVPNFEVFTRFNPLYINFSNDVLHSTPPNMAYTLIASGNSNSLLNDFGISLSTSNRNGFWGAGYDSMQGKTSVPMLQIPTKPLYSLVDFSNANISRMPSDPMRAIGNSLNNIYMDPKAPIGVIYTRFDTTVATATAGDHSWLCNNGLFDRYYLSGIHPFFDHSAGGAYNRTGTIPETLGLFYQRDELNSTTHYSNANANPNMVPYIPDGKTVDGIITELSADDGYKKMAAYSLLKGQFNVNSTSVDAWQALLRANRNLAIEYAQGIGTDTDSGNTPFPNGSSPSNPNGQGGLDTPDGWIGLSRLSDDQVLELAENIVEQVQLRGPFMSLSDFVNHRTGTPVTDENYTGAIQAAIDNSTTSGINSDIQNVASPVIAGAAATDYPDINWFQGRDTTFKSTTSGIPTDITQADILRPIVSRMNARSDTFRVRAYGEALDTAGNVIARATCEALVQRVPEYIDPVTDAANNEPWDEENNPHDVSAAGTNLLNSSNQRFGRKFKIVNFRWLTSEE